MLDLKELSAKADKVIKLARLMDEAFGNAHAEDHLKLAIMAGLDDARHDGFKAADNSREVG